MVTRRGFLQTTGSLAAGNLIKPLTRGAKSEEPAGSQQPSFLISMDERFASQGVVCGAVNSNAANEFSPAVDYPRPLMFRSNTPETVNAAGFRIGMMISDQFVAARRYSDEMFKLRYPNKPVLIHVAGAFISANAYTSEQMMEDRGLVGTRLAARYIYDHGGYREILSPDFVPMPDFLGYWIYEPGENVEKPIPVQQVVVVRVKDPTRYEPLIPEPPGARAGLKRTTGATTTPRVVLMCPRGPDGKFDWLRGELGEVVSTNTAAKTVTIRRFKTSRGWPELPTGTYLASNAARYNREDLWGMRHTPPGCPYHTPLWPWMMPNFTPFCPVDPRNGLNAGEWFARHFIERKKKYYPDCDGYTLDVTAGPFIPGTAFIADADCNNDGVTDMGQINGVNYWALGMYDFVYYMRHGVPGKFKGLGSHLLLSWDSDNTNEQRFFDLINGAEYEFGMIRDTGLFSSNLDRLLLWFERGRSPRITYISDKLPKPAYHNGSLKDLPDEPGYRMSDWRLNAACAAMGSGYIHSDASRGPSKVVGYPNRACERACYGGSALPLDYDEYHEGKAGIYGWLGTPSGPSERYTGQLGPPLFRFDSETALPRVVANDARSAGRSERLGARGIHFDVSATGPYYNPAQKFTLVAELPIAGAKFKEDAEYSVIFRARGSSPFARVGERYRSIPRCISIRFRVNGMISGPRTPEAQRRTGNVQDLLLFERDRPINVTLVAPTNGAGVLEIDLTESPGTIDISNLEIRSGSGDVLYRKFGRGLVVLNGSKDTAVTFPIGRLFPGEFYTRLDGIQDPSHNNGRPVPATLEVPAHDAYFLLRSLQ